jgi:hypothetical protein
MVVDMQKDISRETMEQVNKGETGLSLLGTLHYEDMADQSHTTTFCYTWDVKNQTLIAVRDPTVRTYT